MKDSYRKIQEFKRLIRKLRLLHEGEKNEKTSDKKADSNK